MRTALKWFIVFCILCVTFALPVILQDVLSPSSRTKTTPTSNAEVTTLPSSSVRFVSIAPTLAKAGESFLYRVIVQATPEQNVTVTVPKKPEWLSLDPTTLVLSGTIPKTVGSFTVTLQATAQSGVSVEQTFTVVAESSNQSVQGAKTSAGGDPFHPSITPKGGTIMLPAQPEATQEALLPTEAAVLGEQAQAEPTIQVTALIYGTAILLSLACGYLIAKIVRNGKDEVHRMSSGAVIQSSRS